MPLRTRAFCYALGAVSALDKPLDQLTPDQLARRRALSPDPRFPVTLVTGKVYDADSRDSYVEVRDGQRIPVRIHRPAHGSQAGTAAGRVLLYLHGGGFAVGRPLDYESLLTQIVAETGAIVVAPDYRLAPEAKAPTAVHDAIDVFEWVRSSPTELGEVRSVVVAGDSAGGNLSALVAIDARDRGVRVAGQILAYPVTDLAKVHTYRNAPMLTGEAIDVYNKLYLQNADVADIDPGVSPLRADSLAGVAPALVQTAEFDPLCEEGEAYAARLRAAGVPIRLTRWRGVPHGYLNFPGAAPAAWHARAEIIDQLDEWWTS